MGTSDRAAFTAPVTAASLESLPPTRRAMLVAIKRLGEARAEALAGTLGITVSGVRQHLGSMAADGLVAHRELKGGPGRPKFVYVLTPAGEDLFPRAYGELANELIEHIEAEDPGLLPRIFERRRERRRQSALARLDGLPFAARVAELAAILDEDGYLAEARQREDGSWELIEHNCALLSVALRHGHACSSEIEFLRGVLPGASVDRVAHIASGAFACVYHVREGP